MRSKVAIIAEKYLATGYELAGIVAFPVESLDEAKSKLKEIMSTGEYRIILLPEKLASQLREERENPLEIGGVPSLFVIIPDFEGPTGERTKELHDIISKAVGVKLKYEE